MYVCLYRFKMKSIVFCVFVPIFIDMYSVFLYQNINKQKHTQAHFSQSIPNWMASLPTLYM